MPVADSDDLNQVNSLITSLNSSVTITNGVLSVTSCANLETEQCGKNSNKQPNTVDSKPIENGPFDQIVNQTSEEQTTLSEDHAENENDGDVEGLINKPPIKTGFRNWSKHQWILLLSLLTAVLFSGATFSMIAPFFPGEAKELGANELETGLVFSMFQATVFIMSPIYGLLIVKIGPRFMCIAGSFLSGGCCILFGLLDYTSGAAFLILAFLIRAVSGNGYAMLGVACWSILLKEFPSETSFISGLIETISGLGFVLGPVLGAALFETGGFTLPFLVVGGITIVDCGILVYVLPQIEETESQFTNFIGILKIPGVFILYLHSMVTAACYTFLDPVLSPWMITTFNKSPSIVGLVFAGWSGIYALLSPAVGKLADRGYLYSPMIIGLFGCGLVYLMMGPSPLLKFVFGDEKYFSLAVTVCILLGAFGSGIYVPPYQATVNLLFINGYDDSMTTYGMVSGLVSSSYSLGALTGPLLGGELTRRYGFEWATTYMALTIFFMAVLLSSFYIVMRLILKKPLSPADVKATLLLAANAEVNEPIN